MHSFKPNDPAVHLDMIAIIMIFTIKNIHNSRYCTKNQKEN